MLTGIVLAIVVIVLISWLIQRRNRNGPPGPFQWPIIGNLLDIVRADAKYPDMAFSKLAEKYGDVMSLRFGVHNAVVLSSYTAVKDLLGREEFADRYDKFAFVWDRSFYKSYGLIWQNGVVWQSMRNYAIRSLRRFGLSKTNSMEMFIGQELEEFMDVIDRKLASQNGIVTIDNEFFDLSVVNLLWCSVAGFRFSHSDERVKNLLLLQGVLVKAVCFDSVILPYPFIRHWFPEWSGWNAQKRVFKEMNEFMQALIDDIWADYTAKGSPEPESFIQDFLVNKKNSEKDSGSIFIDEQLIMVLNDLFAAGSHTSSGQLCHIVLYMILRPDVQKRIQDEIDGIVGHEISFLDLESMPYTEASLLEVFRISKSLPVPPARGTNADVEYKGYLIKKDSMIAVNYGSILHDKQFWGDPEVFRPERFLNESQTEISKEARDHVLIFFGWGKRVCIGESLARQTMFSYLTTILKKYTLEIPDPSKPPTTDCPPDATLKPYPFEAKWTRR